MKKIRTILALFFVATNIFAATLEDALSPLENTNADKWYLESWREGYSYEQIASYEIDCTVKLDHIKSKDTSFLGWLQNSVKNKVKDLLNEGGTVKGYFSGDAVSSTEVICNAENLRLLRYYPSVDSNRILYAKLDVDFGVDKSMWNYLNEESGVSDLVTNSIAGLSTSVFLSVDPTLTSPGLVFALTKMVSKPLGGYIQEKFDNFIKENKISKTENGFILDSNGAIFQNYIKNSSNGNISKFDNFGALAIDLTKDFHLKGYFIDANKSTGELLYLKMLDKAEDYESILNSIVTANMYKVKGTDIISTAAEKLKEPSRNAKGLLQRESFALNKKIFDSEKRKLGDSWVVDAEFLNSFLHPDLKGKIKGNLVLSYTDNTIIRNNRSKDTINVRVIEILDRAKIGGVNINTDLVYSEEGFSATWQSDSLGVLYVDKKTGVITKAILDFRTKSSSQLPKTSLTAGFVGVGNSKLKIKYNCYASETGVEE